MSDSPIRLATRQSPLALWQANWVADQLKSAGHKVELVLLTTRGDVDHRPIDGSSAVGMFTKGIQRSVLNGESDVAIHSLKDLPTAETDGLRLIATPRRAPVGDCLISRDGLCLKDLPERAVIGTGSRRREAQLRHLRSDFDVRSIRGNVETRLSKLKAGEYDAIILAEAGLGRLEMEKHITERIPLDVMLPAPGQGSLGIEVRIDDQRTGEALLPLNDPETNASVTAERSMMSTLQGGCLAPIGTFGRVSDGELILDGAVVAVDGKKRLFAEASGAPEEAKKLGERLANKLLAQGAKEIIDDERPTGDSL